MTENEAIKVLGVISGGGGGCSDCVSSLVVRFIEVFPEKKDLAIGWLLEVKGKTWAEWALSWVQDVPSGGNGIIVKRNG